MRRFMLDLRRVLATPSRNPRMAVVIGRLLASAFIICFLTGLYSHFSQEPLPWMRFLTRPQSLYQLTQGVHITAGIACFPLLLAKLYVIYPQLFQTPPIRGFLHFLERASITIFVSASLVQITIGLINTYQWYPWPFSFRRVHFALAIVIIGSLAIHIAAKLPIIARYWSKKDSYDDQGSLLLDDEDRPLTKASVTAELATVTESTGPIARRIGGVTGRIIDWIDTAPPPEPRESPELPESRVSRRGFVTTIAVVAAAVVALTAGQSFKFLDALNVFAPRKQGIGPNSLPINRTAAAARVTESAVHPGWMLSVRRGDTVQTYSYAELSALPQHDVELPIACVEGWSQVASWRGVRLRDLTDRVGAYPDEDLRVTSLEAKGGYRVMEMGSEFVQDDLTLVALQLNGEKLSIDHGYPARMIAPARPGVLQTKWLSSIEVI